MHINELPPEDADNEKPHLPADDDSPKPVKPAKNTDEPKPLPPPTWLSWCLAAASWLVIAGVVLFIMFGREALTEREEKTTATDAPVVSRLTFDWQAKFMTGYSRIITDADLPEKQKKEFKEEFAKSIDQIDQGALRQRLGAAALTLEFDGPQAALKRLNATKKLVDDSKFKQPEELLATMDALQRLLRDYERKKWNAPNVAPAEMKRIEKELGFAGALVLAPSTGSKEPSDERKAVLAKAQTFTGMLIAIGLSIAAWGGLGLVILTLWVLAVLISSGFPNIFKMQLQAGSAHGRVYAETFAIWLGGFVVTNLLMSLVIEYMRASMDAPMPREYGMLLQIVVFLGSLIVLVWPVIRGVSWRQVRQDIGWEMNSPVTDTLIGPFVHSASMPIIAIGLVLVVILASLGAQFSAGGADDPLEPVVGPSHPIAGWLADAGVVEIGQIFFLACVCAPIVEETMFRGVLYKHLRDETSHWSTFGSVAISTLLNSFIFAAIHPQGIVAIPLLMSLAIGFTLAREWRNSLIAPMVAHGVNNAAAMTLMLLLFRN